jgi:hypothetical protein
MRKRILTQRRVGNIHKGTDMVSSTEGDPLPLVGMVERPVMQYRNFLFFFANISLCPLC